MGGLNDLSQWFPSWGVIPWGAVRWIWGGGDDENKNIF